MAFLPSKDPGGSMSEALGYPNIYGRLSHDPFPAPAPRFLGAPTTPRRQCASLVTFELCVEYLQLWRKACILQMAPSTAAFKYQFLLLLKSVLPQA